MQRRDTPAFTLLASLIVPMVCVALLGGCSGQGSPERPASQSTSKMEDSDGVSAEYRETVKNIPLRLPAGVAFPKTPPGGAADGVSERGMGEIPAYFFWLCSWERTYVDAFNSHDPAATTTALTELSKWENTDFAQKYIDDPSGGWNSHVLAPAKLGDPSGVEADMGSCPA